MKKIMLIFAFFVLALGFAAPQFSNAQEQGKVYISFFYGDGCPHCADEEVFLEKLEKEFSNIKINAYEVWSNRDNIKLLEKVSKELGITVSGVPVTLIGTEVISGYLNDETTGAKIRSIVQHHSQTGCIDLVDHIQEHGSLDGVDITGANECTVEQEGVCDLSEGVNCSVGDEQAQGKTIALPFFGEIDPQKWSLPVLTVVIAGIDGFNPCAMWVLIFLISLLIGMQNKRKMWMLGSAFILASGVVYFLFLSAWLNLFLFLGFIAAIRIVIGLVAVASGAFHLKEWWTNRDGVCKVGDQSRKQKIMDRFKRITEEQNFWLALGGIIIIAFAVNLVELVCSAGLPAIYTHVLSGANLAPISYYLYLLLYILIFMLDDMLIFVIAMTTLQVTGLSTKYSRWSNLVGGIVILLLGLLLIFRPGWVMFG